MSGLNQILRFKLGLMRVRTKSPQVVSILSDIYSGLKFEPSVATAITDVFRKNGINVLNKFVRILKIFTKIYDIKNRGVIYGT